MIRVLIYGVVRKGKSLLFGHIISRIFKNNVGGTATIAENRHLAPNIFLPFLAELDISESFETNLKISLVFSFDT